MKGSDEHGQPWNTMFNRKNRKDRGINELIGLCKGVAADGVICQSEAVAIQKWLQANREVLDCWPGDMIHARIGEMLCDGHLDPEEKTELFELIDSLGSPIAPGEQPVNLASSLPFDNPMPKIIFNERVFCFTGRFISGTRTECQAMVADMAGLISTIPTKQTDYLVIGEIGSRDWAHTSYGRKIEHAVELRRSGVPLAIVSEQHWIKHALEY